MWLSGELVGLMTWWLWVWYPDEANFLDGVVSPLTSAEAWESAEVVSGFGKKTCVSNGVRKPWNMGVTDHHDMTLAVRVALNPSTVNQ